MKQYEAVCAANGLTETHSNQLKALKQKALLAQKVYKKQAAEDAENGILPPYLQKEFKRFLKDNKEKLTPERKKEIKELLYKYYITNVAEKEGSREPTDRRMAKVAYNAIKIELEKKQLKHFLSILAQNL